MNAGEEEQEIEDLETTFVAAGSAGAHSPARSVGGPGEAALVPRGGSFEGQVAIVGATRIEGSIRGSLRGPGQLFVGPQARIEGRIECESLESEGEIVGPVEVETRARLSGRGRLDGDLRAPTVVLEDDAVWNGRALVGCKASEDEAAGVEGESPS